MAIFMAAGAAKNCTLISDTLLHLCNQRAYEVIGNLSRHSNLLKVIYRNGELRCRLDYSFFPLMNYINRCWVVYLSCRYVCLTVVISQMHMPPHFRPFYGQHHHNSDRACKHSDLQLRSLLTGSSQELVGLLVIAPSATVQILTYTSNILTRCIGWNGFFTL